MERTPSTPSATLIDTHDLDRARERSREAALKAAGERGLPVREVRHLQRQAFYVILIGEAKGTDGASTNGGVGGIEEGMRELPAELKMQADEWVEEDDRERMQAIRATPDAHVFRRNGTMAGFQVDGTKKVGLADDIVADPEAAERVSKHEGKHREQEGGDETLPLPPTGDPEIDSQRGEFRRLVFREDGAIRAEGGLSTHTPEYHGFVGTADAVVRYLNESGQDGDRMVQEAGDTVEGFRRLREAVIIASVRKRIKERSLAAMH